MCVNYVRYKQGEQAADTPYDPEGSVSLKRSWYRD